jgi:ribosome-binding protein aMBF1 (putative translation factor)
MSQTKTTTKRRSWESIKRTKAKSAERRRAYREARDAFDLAEQVRTARERLGMTQAELAARIGSTQPAIARLEAGGVTPNLATLRRIASALSLELVVQLRSRRVAA